MIFFSKFKDDPEMQIVRRLSMSYQEVNHQNFVSAETQQILAN